jgi:hypothetical protein
MLAIIEYRKKQFEEMNNARKKIRSEEASSQSDSTESSDGAGESNDVRGE